MSEIATTRRVEKSVRKEVTACVELDGLKGCRIRCIRLDLYCPKSTPNLKKKEKTYLSFQHFKLSPLFLL